MRATRHRPDGFFPATPIDYAVHRARAESERRAARRRLLRAAFRAVAGALRRPFGKIPHRPVHAATPTVRC